MERLEKGREGESGRERKREREEIKEILRVTGRLKAVDKADMMTPDDV